MNLEVKVHATPIPINSDWSRKTNLNEQEFILKTTETLLPSEGGEGGEGGGGNGQKLPVSVA